MSHSLLVARVHLAALKFVPCDQPACPAAMLNQMREIICDDLFAEEDHQDIPATSAFYFTSAALSNDDLKDG